MQKRKDITIWFVDSDKQLSSSFKAFCSDRFHVETFSVPQDCLNRLSSAGGGVLIIDCTLLDEPCLDNVSELCRISPTILVIATGANITISRVVELMKQGLYDFIPKPYHLTELMNSLLTAVNTHKLSLKLTCKEEQVLSLILRGILNKEIARLLNRSVRTIEEHRLHISKKLGANNKADFIKLGLEYFYAQSGKAKTPSTQISDSLPESESLTG